VFPLLCILINKVFSWGLLLVSHQQQTVGALIMWRVRIFDGSINNVVLGLVMRRWGFVMLGVCMDSARPGIEVESP
jgi:hypothetical protein